MRVLLDECVPKKLRRDLPGHEVRTVTEMGWTGTRNGPLLRQAAPDFDAFLTVDQGIEFQQSLTGLDLAVIVMAARTNDIEDLRPLTPRVLAALASARSGEVLVVRAQQGDGAGASRPARLSARVRQRGVLRAQSLAWRRRAMYSRGFSGDDRMRRFPSAVCERCCGASGLVNACTGATTSSRRTALRRS